LASSGEGSGLVVRRAAEFHLGCLTEENVLLILPT
jgi:hypothetical protein